MTAETMTKAAPRPGPGLWDRIRDNRDVLALPVMFLLAVVVFSIGAENFLTADNLTNVARQSVYLLIVAMGQLVVMICGGMDLSVGSNVALTSVGSAIVMAGIATAMPEAPWLALWAGLGAGLAIGTAVGLVNGLGVTVLGINPFMMTLGMSSVVFGITLFISGGVPIYGIPMLHGEIFGFGRIAGFPIPSIFAIAMVALTWVALEWTRFGRHLYAAGGNDRAARLSGVHTGRVRVAAYMLCGLMAALSGLLMTARLGTGEANIGGTLPLESIAACVISGVALSGGRGRTLAVVVGTLLIMLVQNGLNLMQVGAYAQSVATGGILIIAMALSRR